MCYEAWYMDILPYAIFLMLYLIGIPTYFIWALKRRPYFYSDYSAYQELQKHEKHKDLNIARFFIGKNSFKDTQADLYLEALFHWERRFQTLTLQYTPRYFYWEILVLTRKFLVTGVKLFFTKYPVFQATFIMMLLVVYLFIQRTYLPFIDKSVNKLEAAALSASILVLLLGILIHSEDNLHPVAKELIGTIAVIFVISCVVYITILIYHFIIEHIEHPELQLLNKDGNQKTTDKYGNHFDDNQLAKIRLARIQRTSMVVEPTVLYAHSFNKEIQPNINT